MYSRKSKKKALWNILCIKNWMSMAIFTSRIRHKNYRSSIFHVLKRKKIFHALWKRGLHEYDEMFGIAWQWQSIDGCHVKSPGCSEKSSESPVDRKKKVRKDIYLWTNLESLFRVF